MSLRPGRGRRRLCTKPEGWTQIDRGVERLSLPDQNPVARGRHIPMVWLKQWRMTCPNQCMCSHGELEAMNRNRRTSHRQANVWPSGSRDRRCGRLVRCQLTSYIHGKCRKILFIYVSLYLLQLMGNVFCFFFWSIYIYIYIILYPSIPIAMTSNYNNNDDNNSKNSNILITYIYIAYI